LADFDFAGSLLDWYDKHARDLPWRIGPQEIAAARVPDPYRVWLSEIMLQQTTVAAVKTYFNRFTARWPTVTALAAANDADVMAEWSGLGYYARARNRLKCARLVADEMGGQFPDTINGLLKLPGIGPYTAAAIAAIAFDRPEAVVDTNVKRVMVRIFGIQQPPDKALPAINANAAHLTPHKRPGDYAQAVMDLGAGICTPKALKCDQCPWASMCRAHRLGIADKLPVKAKPTRLGIVYVARRSDGAWLLERRPAKGLLGGMLAWPTSDWCDDPAPAPPIKGRWKPSNALIRHTFTHFHLRLSLQTKSLEMDAAPTRGSFVPDHQFARSDLPTLMRKVFDAARPAFPLD